ncbi:iron aquisition yersiniabactin synthesis enzyme (Irp2) [Klebsiella pneumoniae]|uniref:Iron aquisition yersiniabactin synthesis enzyme (Irp2) n=1 Tax=Klebsiella pneumoniae TaxID=573 RepID=A0A378AR35_KLEPN|nr:iron aquisition yersiniabactin synthesis enzyme (Irp2) [Klebsiella pneumoniae]
MVVAVGNSQHRRLVAFAKLHDRHQAQALQAKEAEAAALAQGIIVNPAQRLAFKLKEPHIRALDGLGIALTVPADSTRYIKRRSYRHFSAQKTTLAQLGQLLSGLGQMRLPGLPFASMPMRLPGGYTRCKHTCTCIQTRSKREYPVFTTSTRDRAVLCR